MCGGAFVVCIVLYEEEGDRTKKTAPKGCLTDYLVGFNGNGNWIVVVGVFSGGVCTITFLPNFFLNAFTVPGCTESAVITSTDASSVGKMLMILP